MIKLNLPKPISTNALFANVRGRGRVKSARYNTWTHHAAAMLADQRPLPRIDYPCRILFAVGEIGMRANSDGDNTLKCLLDALISNGVLSDDNRKIVRGVGMEWVAGKEGVTAHIMEIGNDGF
jgi:Holliday junction resolvase RusA-like endonuclease